MPNWIKGAAVEFVRFHNEPNIALRHVENAREF